MNIIPLQEGCIAAVPGFVVMPKQVNETRMIQAACKAEIDQSCYLSRGGGNKLNIES